MSYKPKMQLPPPANWDDFENLCWSLWKKIWNDPSAHKNGRQGQPQNGVDIYGRPNQQHKWAGIQCKGKENFSQKKLSKKEIDSEVNKACNFQPILSEYIIATTAPRDQRIQEYIRVKTELLENSGSFRVDICAWNDIVDLLYEYEPPIAAMAYPAVFGGQFKGLLNKLIHLVEDNINISDDKPSTDDDSNSQRDIFINDGSQRNYQFDGEDPFGSIDANRVLSIIAKSVEEQTFESNPTGGSSSDTLYSDSVNQDESEEDTND